jgi:hypothetical protein
VSTGRRPRAFGWVASIAAIVAAPVVVDLVAFAWTALGYHGQCGPHPTDIPARPCTYAEYLRDAWDDPFALAGLLLIDGAVVTVTAIGVGMAWLVVALTSSRR